MTHHGTTKYPEIRVPESQGQVVYDLMSRTVECLLAGYRWYPLTEKPGVPIFTVAKEFQLDHDFVSLGHPTPSDRRILMGEVPFAVIEFRDSKHLVLPG